MQTVFEEKSLFKVHVHCYTVPIFPLDHPLLLFLAPKERKHFKFAPLFTD